MVPGLGRITVRPWWGWLHPHTWKILWLWSRWVRRNAASHGGGIIEFKYGKAAL